MVQKQKSAKLPPFSDEKATHQKDARIYDVGSQCLYLESMKNLEMLFRYHRRLNEFEAA